MNEHGFTIRLGSMAVGASASLRVAKKDGQISFQLIFRRYGRKLTQFARRVKAKGSGSSLLKGFAAYRWKKTGEWE